MKSVFGLYRTSHNVTYDYCRRYCDGDCRFCGCYINGTATCIRYWQSRCGSRNGSSRLCLICDERATSIGLERISTYDCICRGCRDDCDWSGNGDRLWRRSESLSTRSWLAAEQRADHSLEQFNRARACMKEILRDNGQILPEVELRSRCRCEISGVNGRQP
jgi:hypothetical protein